MANAQFRIKTGLVVDETTSNDGNLTIANGKIKTDANDGTITLKSTDTTDNLPITLALETGETEIIADEVLGKITFAAPDETQGGDGALVSAGIQAIAEGTFTATANATSLGFMTGSSEAATQKMKLNSDGDLHLTTDTAQMHFGADSEVILRHVPDHGLAFISSQASGPVALELTNTNTDAAGSIFRFNKNANTPADNDKIGVIQFQASDGDNADMVYGSMRGVIADVDTTTDDLELGAVQIRALTSNASTSTVLTDGLTISGVSTGYGEGAVRATIGGQHYGETYDNVQEKYAGQGTVSLFQWPTKKDFTWNDDGGGNGVTQFNQGAINIGGGHAPYTFQSSTNVSGTTAAKDYMTNLWVNATGYSEARITTVASQDAENIHSALGSALVLETISSQNNAAVYFTRNRNHTSYSFVNADTSESLTDITWAAGLSHHGTDNHALSRDFIIGYYADDYNTLMGGTNHPILDAQAHVRITASDGHLTLEKDNAELRLSDGSYITGFKAHGTMTASAVYTLPAAFPASDKVLQSTSSGVLSWESAGAAAAITSVAGMTDNNVITATGSAAVTGESTLTYSMPLLTVTDTTTSSATQGGKLRLASNDGVLMADDHRLGVIEFAGAEDGSSTISVGARIQAVARDAWDGTNNDADLQFYTTNGTTESLALTLDADNLATFVGDVTISGNDLNFGNGATIVNTSGSLLTVTEATTQFSGVIKAHNTTASSATEGGKLQLSADDGAVMADNHRLGVIEFLGAEDTSNNLTIGARIQAIADATWSDTENGASLEFYTTDGNASESVALTLDSDNLATFAGAVTVGGNLTVSGTTTTVNTATVEVEDNILNLNRTQASPDTATAATSGIEIYRGNGVTQASLIFDEADDTWDITNDFKINGTTASSSTTTGALVVAGGVGVAEDIYIGADAYITDDLSLTSDSAVFTMGADSGFSITHDGDTGATIAGGPVTITPTEASTWSTSSGALTLTSAAAATWSTAAGALTLTSAAAATWSTAAGALTLTSAAAATWSTTAGILTLDGDDGIQISSTATGNIDLDSVADIVLDVGSTKALYYQEAGTTYALQDHANVTVAQGSGVTVDTFLCTTYQATKYLILVTDVDNNNFMACELLVLGDDTDDAAYLTQYAVVYNDTTDKDLGVFTATESSSTITLTYTANDTANASSTGHKVRAVATRIAAH